jgi:hypothetical protein
MVLFLSDYKWLPSWECHFFGCSAEFDSAEEAAKHECRRHYACMGCHEAHDTWEDLLQHCRQFRCSLVCKGCLTRGAIHHFDRALYWRHVKEHNVCTKCERHFDTQSNLIHGRAVNRSSNHMANIPQHELTHRSPTYASLGVNCDRSFTTYGGMILHLEVNICPSQIDIVDLGCSAAKCFQWSKFVVDREIRQSLLENQFVYDQPGCPGLSVFKCPTCRVQFPKLSSLFMHVESPACAQGLGEGAIGKLRKWLSNRHS